jgi:hypothetical protein
VEKLVWRIEVMDWKGNACAYLTSTSKSTKRMKPSLRAEPKEQQKKLIKLQLKTTLRVFLLIG